MCSQRDKELRFGVEVTVEPLYTCTADFHFSARGLLWDFNVNVGKNIVILPSMWGLSALLYINQQQFLLLVLNLTWEFRW